MNNNNLFSTIRNILLGVLLLSAISLGIKKFDLLGFESPENIRNNAQLNQKATMAYRNYWHWYNNEVPEDARDTNDINRRNIYGNVVLVKQPYLNK